MTRPRVVLAAAAALLGLALVLAGCAAAPTPATRTSPNAVELAAVQRTADAFFAGSSRDSDSRAPWVQLWTSNQFPVQLRNCAAEQSHGQLAVDVQLPLLRALSYHIVGSGSEPNEAEASRIIEYCAAAIPLDDRVLRVPASEWETLYSYELTTLKPCLVAHGYPVGSVPTRHDWESLLRAQQPWSPYDGVIVKDRAAWYRVSDACPALPAGIRLESAQPALSPFTAG